MYSNTDEPFRREEDRRWREQVDARLASLTSGENDQNDRLDELSEEFREVRHVLDGDPSHREDQGIKGELHDISVTLNSLRALMQPDSLGNGGIIARLKKLEATAERDERNLEYKWKFWTALSVAVFSIVGIFVKEWPSISERWNNNMQQLTATKSTTKKARHKRAHKVVVEPDNDQEEVPE